MATCNGLSVWIYFGSRKKFNKKIKKFDAINFGPKKNQISSVKKVVGIILKSLNTKVKILNKNINNDYKEKNF